MRNRLRWLIIGGITLIFLGTQIYFAFVIATERSLLLNDIRVGGWMAAEMESELLRLQRDLAIYRAHPDPDTEQAARTQFEIYWSRIDVVANSQEAAPLRRNSDILTIINRAAISLSVMDDYLQKGLSGQSDGLDKLNDVMQGLEPDFRKATLITINQEKSGDQRDKINHLAERLMAIFIVMVGAGLGLLGVVYALAQEGLGLARRARQAELAANEARHCLEDALDHITDGFVQINRQGEIQHQNRVFCQMYPAIKKPVTDIRARAGQVWEEKLADGRIVQASFRATGDGGVVCLYTDISHLKIIEQQLRHQLLAMDNTHEGISVCDADGLCRYINRAHAQIMGAGRPDELVGRPWSILYDQAEIARFRRDIFPVLKKNGCWSGEVTARKMDGTAILQDVALTQLPDGSMICVMRDVTDRKRKEQEKLDLQAQLFQAQKMDAVGRLAGGIAHDFNNILAAILGYGALLVDDLPEDSEDYQFAQHICRSAERARDLVQQILAFSRTQGGSMEMANLGDVCHEIADMLRATLPSTIKFSMDVTPDVPEIRANPTQIGQVLMNLCVNARDAIGDRHANLEIALRPLDDLTKIEWPGGHGGDRHLLHSQHLLNDPRGRTILTIGAFAPSAHYLVLSVRDTGMGIPAAIMERMFEPFFSSKPAHKGTGLGLSAVHGIVAGHCGAMRVSSCPGEGSLFEVFLPVTGDAEELASHEREKNGIQKGAEHILLVDDESTLADFSAIMLRRLGYRVSLAGNGAEALQCLAQMDRNGLPVDLVITDQTMPMMTGTELARHIREIYPEMPIILCTGYSESVSPETATEFGLNAFLYKPLSSRELPITLRRVLDGDIKTAC